MKIQLANVSYGVLDCGSCPLVSILGRIPIPFALYGAITFSPFLSLVSWQRQHLTGRHCVPCAAIPCKARKGSKS